MISKYFSCISRDIIFIAVKMHVLQVNVICANNDKVITEKFITISLAHHQGRVVLHLFVEFASVSPFVFYVLCMWGWPVF